VKALPDLYKIYTEPIAVILSNKAFGIDIGRVIIDLIMYADDLITISNNAVDAECILNEITNFGAEHLIQFNASKTNLIVIGKKEPTDLKLCNSSITEVESFKYLGTIVQKDGSHKLHVEARRKAAFTALNNLKTIGLLNNNLDYNNRKKLFIIYIRPVLYYGTDAMSLNEQETNIIAETEALILKNIMSLPIYSLTSELYNVLSLLFAKEHLRKIQLNFLLTLQQNEYTKKSL